MTGDVSWDVSWDATDVPCRSWLQYWFCAVRLHSHVAMAHGFAPDAAEWRKGSKQHESMESMLLQRGAPRGKVLWQG